MTTMTFDSIACVRMLEEGGFTRQQAEAQMEVLRQQAELQARQTEIGRAVRRVTAGIATDVATGTGEIRRCLPP